MPQVWKKLDRLADACKTEIKSHLDPARGLCWKVTIERQNEPPITVTRYDIQEAAREAVTEAEQRGWIAQTPPASP